PDEIIKSADPLEKADPVPAVSEPKAKDYVAKVVKAFTGGKPELVAKGKVSRVVMKGTMVLPVENQFVPLPVTRTRVAVWHETVDERLFSASELVTLRGQPVN